MAQLPLFDEAPEGGRPQPDAQGRDPLFDEHATARPLAQALPRTVKFGTSSWSFPGWRGLVFSRTMPAASIARDGLKEYAHHPLLRTVGVDRTYYAPVSDEDLRHYASLVPPSFCACFKAPAAVTSAILPAFGPTTGHRAVNPEFLSVDRLEQDLLAPLDRSFASHTELVILEFPPVPSSVRPGVSEFLERLEAFLERLPRTFRYVVEIREARYLTSAYRAVLERVGVGHTYTYWSRMPMPLEQARTVPLRAGISACVRLLMRPGTSYEPRRERFKPFDRIVEPDTRMRSDVTTLVRDAAGLEVPLSVLVNNKAEGSAPLTIRALAGDVARALRS